MSEELTTYIEVKEVIWGNIIALLILRTTWGG